MLALGRLLKKLKSTNYLILKSLGKKKKSHKITLLLRTREKYLSTDLGKAQPDVWLRKASYTNPEGT